MIPVHPDHGKMIIASGVAVFTVIADALVGDSTSWESMSLKGLLIVAVVYLVRELAKQREAERATNTEREAMMRDIIKESNATMRDLKNATDIQTSYFKTVAQTIINRDVHPHLPKEDGAT